jgi:uncharacterized protein
VKKHIDRNRIASEIFEVDGGVDFSVGNIDFAGCIKIKGNMLSGFKVKVSESVEIGGNVDRAVVEAGVDVRIAKGFYGSQNSRISAGRNIHARSLDNADVEAGGDVVVAHYILNSNVAARGFDESNPCGNEHSVLRLLHEIYRR